MKHIHILGVCGAFMGSLALIARELGYQVRGSDGHSYPPMSSLLQEQGITVHDGYTAQALQPAPDCVLVGNALSRGNPAVEYLLDADLPFQSGPEWLRRHVLPGRRVLAVSGTHGKTTTSGMLAWILECAGREPGFLMGGVAENFSLSGRLGCGQDFVIEADEYDTAFFDKRSKFIHYQPRILIINNIEFDHADIFADIADIRRQFHHLVRIMPGSGTILARAGDEHIRLVLKQGCWTPVQYFSMTDDADWYFVPEAGDCSRFRLVSAQHGESQVSWSLFGRHNALNATAAVAAAVAAGVSIKQACDALGSFTGVKRRMQHLGEINAISVYDDFAHHPTAILASIQALRQRIAPDGRLVAVMEPRSNTLKREGSPKTLVRAFGGADQVFFLQGPGVVWDIQAATGELADKRVVCQNTGHLLEMLLDFVRPGDTVLFMSNGGFGGIQGKLTQYLRSSGASL